MELEYIIYAHKRMKYLSIYIREYLTHSTIQVTNGLATNWCALDYRFNRSMIFRGHPILKPIYTIFMFKVMPISFTFHLLTLTKVYIYYIIPAYIPVKLRLHITRISDISLKLRYKLKATRDVMVKNKCLTFYII